MKRETKLRLVPAQVLVAFGLSWIALSAAGPEPPAPPEETARGLERFEALGCKSCHSIDGSRKLGPSLLGIWGATREMADGSSVVADETYLVESILDPQVRIVRGYGSSMPSYRDLATEEDLPALLGYLRSLRREKAE